MEKDLKVYYSAHNTSFGKILIASTKLGLCAVSFIEEGYEGTIKGLSKFFSKNNIIEREDYHRDIANQLEEYFTGKRKNFDVELYPRGTDFQKKVWDILLSIPYGETWTYKDVAEKLGDTKKCRAVGGAIGRNPIAVIIPCHRVIGSNGKLTGFSAPRGIELKKELLDLEKGA